MGTTVPGTTVGSRPQAFEGNRRTVALREICTNSQDHNSTSTLVRTINRVESSGMYSGTVVQSTEYRSPNVLRKYLDSVRLSMQLRMP